MNANKLQGGKGSGLGLWISKAIIDKHNGKIGVYSEGEGLGSTFFFEIPIERREMSISPIREGSVHYGSSGNLNALEEDVEGIERSITRRMVK